MPINHAVPPSSVDQDLKALLRRVRRMELRARTATATQAAGAYRSRFRGQGMEFDRVRDYSPGDDVRAIDWNVTARAGRPYIKIYREERELSIMLLVDVSGSMRFGGLPPWSQRSKLFTAAEAAAVVAVTAMGNQDRVGLTAFSDHTEHYLPCRRGRNHVLRLLRDLLSFEQAGRPGDMSTAVTELSRSRKRHGIVFVISDFLDPVLDLGKSLARARSRHDIIGVRVSDPAEDDLPHAAGPLWLSDPEHGQIRALAGSRRAAARYRRLLEQQRQQVEQAFRAHACDLVDVRSDGDVVQAMSAFFQRRGRRIRA